MRRNMDTFIRAFIAAVVILITYKMTWYQTENPKEWEVIFLLVVGYYFNDRPQTFRLIELRSKAAAFSLIAEAEAAVRVELLAQLGVALLLVAVTILLFFNGSAGSFPMAIAAAWIGGVALAVAFYFKTPPRREIHMLRTDLFWRLSWLGPRCR